MTDEVRWPDAGEYAQAARSPTEFLLDDELRQGKLRTSPLGIPLPATGRNAAVFRLLLDEGSVAVRCFTRQPRDGRRRYDALRAYVERTAIPAFADARWLPDAIAVGAQRFPMIRMEWVDGLNLDRYVEAHIEDRNRLADLAESWIELLHALEASDVAHGDLQHGNILVEADGAIRLVDLDGIWTPATTDLVPNEVGHRNYQHPQRITGGYWGRSVDAFSALVVAVSLEALAQEPGLWFEHNDGANNLLLAEADYMAPGDTPVWADLDALADPVPSLAARLRDACAADVARLAKPTEMVRVHGMLTTPAPPAFITERIGPATGETPVVPDSAPAPAPAPAPATPVPVPRDDRPDLDPVGGEAPRPPEPTRPDPAPSPGAGSSGLSAGIVFVLFATIVAIIVVFVGVATLGLTTPVGWLA
ncbi:MAG: hypothetical protein RIB98_11565 [Acidimicrobiales bacterium]